MSHSADHNLLFGILALQMDLITRDQLIAGMNAWVLEKTKPLGAIAGPQPTSDRLSPAGRRACLKAAAPSAKHGWRATRWPTT